MFLRLCLAEIVKGDIEFVAHFVVHDATDTDAAWFSQAFEPRGQIDPVAEDVAGLDDDIA